MSSEAADCLLIQNNIIAFYILDGKYDIALSLCRELYSNIEYNEDIDDYYRYFIFNNYGILLWILGNNEDAFIILEKAFSMIPLPRDISYFKARNDKIITLLKTTSGISFTKEAEWNDYLYKQNSHVVGAAWKFWSKLVLFSELQIWSDF